MLLYRDSEKSEITRAYRKLALKWHPDKFIKPEEKKEAEKMFMRIAAGYEVLKDEESRKDYDYMMDHPEETYGNYYRSVLQLLKSYLILLRLDITNGVWLPRSM